MKAFVQSHFWSKSALISFLHTFAGYLAVDAIFQWNMVFSGNFSREALLALTVAVGRSLVKALSNFIVSQLKKSP